MEPELFLESRGSLEEGAAISLGEGWTGVGVFQSWRGMGGCGTILEGVWEGVGRFLASDGRMGGFLQRDGSGGRGDS